jgi:hypothetical protein
MRQAIDDLTLGRGFPAVAPVPAPAPVPDPGPGEGEGAFSVAITIAKLAVFAIRLPVYCI